MLPLLKECDEYLAELHPVSFMASFSLFCNILYVKGLLSEMPNNGPLCELDEISNGTWNCWNGDEQRLLPELNCL